MRIVVGLIQASHPFPLSAVVALTALIGIASARDDLDASLLACVLLTMLLAQLVIGWTNDYADRDADARVQPSKPVPSGKVDARILFCLALAAGLLSLVAAATLGWIPLLCVVAGMGSGLVYNFALKQTPWSWAPYVVAFCALPPFVWSGLGVWDGAFVALYPIALPLTVAAHFANALPDIGTDSESGRRSLAVIAGRSATLRLIRALLLLPVGLVFVSTRFVSYDAVVLATTLGAYGVLLALTWLVYTLGAGRRDYDVSGFRLIAGASLTFVTGWLLSVK